MDIYAFTGVYSSTVRDGSIGFPETFYRVVQDTNMVVLTIEGNSLIGYSPGVWETLKHSLSTLHDPEMTPEAIKEFLESAVTCPVIIDPDLTNEDGKAMKAVGLAEPYRLAVSGEMIEQAKLAHQAILVGMGYHFEIWSPINWLKMKYRIRYRKMTRRNPPDIIA